MPFCEIITKFRIEQIGILKEKIDDKTILFTNDPFILNEVSKLGYNIKLVSDYFGLYNEKINRINEQAIHKFNLIKNMVEGKELEKYNIHNNLKYFHFQRLIFLEIVNKILQEKNNVIFLFNNLVFHYFAILDIAKKNGYESKYGVSYFEKGQIKSIFFDQTRKTKMITIQNTLKGIEQNENILYLDNYEFRIDEIKIKEDNSKYAFFLINNETDFYLKPVYPILKKFKENNTPFSIFTFDLLTYTQLSQKGFNPNDLSEYLDDLSIGSQKIIYKKDLIPKTPGISPTFKSDKKLISSKRKRNVFGKKIHLLKRRIRWDRKIHLLKRRIRWDRKIHLLKRRIRWARKIHLLKRKYRRIKRRLLHVYFTRFQYYRLIRWIVSRPFIRNRLLRFAGFEEDQMAIDIPQKEMKTIQKLVFSSQKIPTNDIVLQSYLSYFQDNYLVNYIANNLAIHTIVNALLKKFKFESIFVAMDGSPSNNTVCNIAKKYSIPTFSLPQIFVRINKIQESLPSASNIFVSGKKIKKELTKLGALDDRIIITGNPRYDFLKSNDEDKRRNSIIERIFKKNIRFSGDLIIVAMSRWHDKDPIWMANLIKFCNKNNLEILIKIHPMYKSPINYSVSKENSQLLKKLCEGLKFIISYDIDLAKLWSQTKVLITEHSIVAVEAALSGIPIIVTNIDNDENFEGLEYQKEGIALHASSEEELSICIKKILYDNKTIQELQDGIKKFCEDYNYLNDGKSADRIYNTLTRNK